ncbi:MAG: hypothetical protein C0410_07175 [Anaerolinea sp.]|nr:hypothetical protein [Anaerolinea sp.]
MKSPLQISICFYEVDCPEAVTISSFFPDGIQRDTINEIRLPYDQTIKLSKGWVAKDQEHLDQNLQHIKWVFSIDDQDFFTEDLLVNGEMDDEDVAGAKNPGTWLAVTLSGWEIGEPHYIRYGFYFDEAVDDGWEVSDADFSSIYTLYVVPADIPTITPGPTITNTAQPKPAVTKAPAQPTATSGAPLVLNITLKVENKCSDAHVVIFNGPMRLKYSVAPGQTVEYQAAAGTYTWKVDNSYNGGPQTLDASMGWWTYTLCQ